jgi:hypothetical protein
VADLRRFQICQEHLSLWLRSSLTGCYFATSFASTRPLKLDYYTPISDAVDLEAIASFIDGTATSRVVAVVLFPSVRTPADLAEVLLTLCQHDRWSVDEVKWPDDHQRVDSRAFGLTWKTSDGPPSDAMGIAPLGTMPVTRRAPYVAIVVWGGPHLNPYIRKTDRVGVTSAPTGLRKDQHKRLMRVTDERVRDLLQRAGGGRGMAPARGVHPSKGRLRPVGSFAQRRHIATIHSGSTTAAR